RHDSRAAESADRGPGPIRIATRSAAGCLRLAVDVDRVGVLPAGVARLLIGRAGDDRAITAGIGIFPGHRRARLTAFEGLHLRRVGAPLVFVVHGGADAIADQTTDRGARDTGRKP